jgi:hypothetical protein
MKPFQKTALVLRNIWKRCILRDIHYSSDYKRLDRYYVMTDPWAMGSQKERHRFDKTNRIIMEEFGRVGTLLEVGCGEGHHSLELRHVCEHLIGVDVSARAIGRASKRYPPGEFYVGDIFSPEISARAPFDLIVACEVLYYMDDVPAALNELSALSNNILATYYQGQMKILDRHVLSLPGVTSKILEFEGSSWRVAWWRSNISR